MFLDVRGCWRCFWILEIFLGVGDVFGCWRCFRMLEMFLDVGDVFGCWRCFWMLEMFLDVLNAGDVLDVGVCFSNLTDIFPTIFPSNLNALNAPQ